MTTLNSRDAAQTVRRWSPKAHILPQFVLGFHLHLGGAARSESFPTHCSRHLPVCSLLPRHGLLEFPGRWTSYFAFQDRAGSRLETEKVGSGVGTRKKLLAGLQHEVGSAFTLGCQGHDGGGWAVLSEWARVAEADGHQRKAVTDPR